MDQLGPLIPLVLILAAAYFLLIRPARKRSQEVNALQRALEVGAHVMLTSGIFGEVVHMDDEQIHVEIAPDVVIRVHRGAIGKIIGELPSHEPDAETDAEVDEPVETEPSAEGDDETTSASRAEPAEETDTDPRGAH